MRSKFLQNILSVGFGSLCAQFLTAFTLPLLTRLYMPSAYAGWALLMSVVLVVASVCTLRYELAIVLPESHDEAANLMLGCTGIVGGIALLSGLLLPWCGFWLIGESFYNELSSWLWSVPLMIGCMGIYQAANAWFTRTREFKWYSLSQVALPFLITGCQILAALWGLRTTSGLILGTLIGQFVATVMVVALIYARYGSLIQSAISNQKIRKSLFKYKAYPLYMTPYSMVATIRERLVYFLFAAYGERSQLGFYNLSARLVNFPNILVSSAVRPVFFQHAASTDFRLLENPVNKALKLLVVGVIPFWILFLFHAEDLFALIFGEPWRDASLYAIILSVPGVPLLLGNWLDRAFDTLGRQRLAFLLEFSFSILSVVALAFGMIFFKSVLIAVCLQAGVLTIYYSYWIVALFHAAGFRRGELLRLLTIAVTVGTVSSAITGFIRFIAPFLVSFVTSIAILSALVLVYLLHQWKSYNQKNQGLVA
jgi:O-antigen/teichoic acid export membrane protein